MVYFFPLVWFSTISWEQIVFSASWYHDPELLPHYIHMDIVTAENPFGCQIFFNLETLEIFQIMKPEMSFKPDESIRFSINEQEIPEECRNSILNSITENKSVTH